MSDVEIVIKISKDIYERFGHEYSEENLISAYVNEVILDAFIKGIVIPEGHGKIIDASNLLTVTDVKSDGSEFTYVSYSEIDGAPAIIEANTGKEDKPHIKGDYFDGFKSGLRTAEWRYDKMRAEIEGKIVKRPWLDFEDRERDRNDAFLEALDIIDKYKTENDRLVEIGSLAPGATVEFGGTKWVVLDKCYPTKYISQSQGVFCIAEKIAFRKTFDEDKCSNWAASSLRKYLNGEFKVNLTAGIGEEALLPFERDLILNDGLKDYGTCVDTISLISRNEYEKYRQYISNKHACWWTLTACSAQNSGRSCCALRVYGGGSLGSGGAVLDGGVVPVVCVRPSFKVKDIEERQCLNCKT